MVGVHGWEQLVQFLFILVLPVVVAAGGLVTLFALGAFFDAAENPDDLRARIEGAFRRPLKPPHGTGPKHYYRAYWQGGA